MSCGNRIGPQRGCPAPSVSGALVGKLCLNSAGFSGLGKLQRLCSGWVVAGMMLLEDIVLCTAMSDPSVLENSTIHRCSFPADRRVRWFDLNFVKVP